MSALTPAPSWSPEPSGEGKTLFIRALAPRSQPQVGDPLKGDQLWAINNAGAFFGFKPDLIIAMDDLARDYAHPEHKGYVESIVDAGCPVYSARADARWPSVEPYPLAEVLKKLGMARGGWALFDNTVNYAFALALALGWRKIAFFGADWCGLYNPIELQVARLRWRLKGFDSAPDWFAYYDGSVVWQRSNLEPGSEAFHWWLGYAEGHGVEVILPRASTVLNRDRKPFFYGYQEQPEL